MEAETNDLVSAACLLATKCAQEQEKEDAKAYLISIIAAILEDSVRLNESKEVIAPPATQPCIDQEFCALSRPYQISGELQTCRPTLTVRIPLKIANLLRNYLATTTGSLDS
jgi:hypothetical protein